MSTLEQERGSLGNVCEVSNYSYRHPLSPPDKWALTQINFLMRQGEFLAIMGDSGSGKTTLINCLNGCNFHMNRGGEHAGSVRLFETDVESVEDFAQITKNYGFIAQGFRDQALASNVESTIALPLESQRIPYQEMHQRVDQIAADYNLTKVKKRGLNELSGGQVQAVLFATMAAKGLDGSKVLFLDDPTSDLDPRAQNNVWDNIANLQRQGVSVVMVDSSNPERLLNAASQVLVLENGHQIFLGCPADLIKDNETAYKAGALVPSVDFREPLAASPAITVNNVFFSYNGEPVINGTTLEIPENSITGIIGPNGSGKTTMLKLMAGLLRPKYGEVKAHGVNMSRLRPREAVRLVSYLPQVGGTFLTGNVQTELDLTPLSIGIDPWVTTDMVGLNGSSDEHPEYLSAGQKQHLAIWCARSSRPKVLLLDEPTKGLNLRERQKLTEELIGLQNEGVTIVFVSHDWRLVAGVTQNLVVMDEGKVVQKGPTKEVMQDRQFFNQLGLPLPW